MQKGFHYDTLLKYIAHIRQSPKWVAVTGNFSFDADTFICWGLIEGIPLFLAISKILPEQGFISCYIN